MTTGDVTGNYHGVLAYQLAPFRPFSEVPVQFEFPLYLRFPIAMNKGVLITKTKQNKTKQNKTKTMGFSLLTQGFPFSPSTSKAREFTLLQYMLSA